MMSTSGKYQVFNLSGKHSAVWTTSWTKIEDLTHFKYYIEDNLMKEEFVCTGNTCKL